MVFTTRLSGGNGGRNGFEAELRQHGITQKNGRPSHPQTQGKVERFQQTLKKWLSAQQPQPATLTQLQQLLDEFTRYCNTHRPHRSLPRQATPATICTARPKAAPGDRGTDAHHRVRTDTVDTNGTITLRHHGRLHHIGIGRAHARTHILLLAQDLHIRIINATIGELLRELTLDPHPRLPAHRTTMPPTPPNTRPRTLIVGSGSFASLER